ncbi:ATP-binding protein [Marmoricola sp. RAF53]|uniref:ATP-binding protein n=1 Tax=Marmoricola sp. RAF53 TaxID=3233059 RepID=UPI003F95BE48
MASSENSTAGPTRGRRAVRLALGTTLFLLTGYAGRATVLHDGGASLVWPAIGVAALWLGSGNRRTWPADVTALVLASVVIYLTTGVSVAYTVVFLVMTLVQLFVFIALVRRQVPGLWGFGGAEPLQRVGQLGRLALAAALSGLAATAVGGLVATLVSGRPDAATLGVLWGRNAVALVVVTTLGVLIGQSLAGSGSIGGALRRTGAALRPATPGRLLEALALVATTVLLSVAIFASGAEVAEALAFLLLVTSVWAGLRFSPVAVALQGLAQGIFGVGATLADDGPFADISSVHTRGLVAQLFVAMTVLTGLALAFNRGERDRADVRLAEAEQASADRARLLDAVLESMTEGLVVTEAGGRVIVRNGAARSLVGLDPDAAEEILRADAYHLFHANGLPLLDEEMPGRRALAGEVVPPEDFHVRSEAVPQGRVVEISAHPLTQNDPDAPRRAMVNIRDVTLDRQHSDALASFAGVVAHDLFNPLSVVGGWTEALEDEFATGSVPGAVGLPMIARIHEATAHMRVLISDLMSYTVARDQSVRAQSVDLTATVRQLARLRADSASAPVIAVDDDLRVWADEGLVRQLFDNLLGNAVKYVAPGVRPAVAVTGREDDLHRLVVRVTDNGIGIPAGQREEVFNSFHRAHRDGYHGTGLGLAICRRIVERHGGTILVEEGPNGIGTTFVLQLPATAEAFARRGLSVPVVQPEA